MLRVEPEIKRDYVDRGTVRLAFHPFLDRGDAPATTLHAAAECAGAQAPLAFWRMHDLIFEHQGDLWQAEAADVLGYAAELGLDVATFAACLNDPVTAEKLARLDQTRRDQDIRVRPSFDINGRVVAGAVPFVLFQEIIAEAEVP